MNPRLHPRPATAVWRALRDSPCGRKLQPDQGRWLELFEAIGARDADAMVAHSTRLLDGMQGVKNAASELAFLAAVAASICRGNQPAARALLEQGALHWMNAGAHITELRFLEGLALQPTPKRVGACAARPS